MTTHAESWQLVTRAQSGDTDAFGQIYAEHHAAIASYIRFRTPSLCVWEDLAQDTFVRALRRIETVTDQGKDIRAWLLTIARNLVTDYFKTAHFRYSWPVDSFGDYDRGTDEDVAGAVSRAFDLARDTVVLEQVLADLTPEQLTVLQLRFGEEMPTAEVAALLGKNIGAVKALQYRATAALGRDERVKQLAVTG